jgi:hypothetical protein
VCLFKGIGGELALQIGTVCHLAVLYDALTTSLRLLEVLKYYPRPTVPQSIQIGFGFDSNCALSGRLFCAATIPSDAWGRPSDAWGQPKVILSGGVVAPGERRVF